MTIELHDITKGVLVQRKRSPLFKHLDFWMEDGERVAVLGHKRAGKTMLLQLICGAEPVDEGWLECTSKVSWPIPQIDFFTPQMTIATNLRFFARMYGIDQDKFVSEVGQLGEIESHLNDNLGYCPRYIRQQLAFALSMWFDFDIYLFDDRVISTPKPFLARATQILEARTRNKGILVATSSPGIALQYCSTAFVLDGGRAEHYTDMKAALKHFNSLAKDTGVEADEEEEEDDDDEPDM
ncbi:MAG: ATP-binding cassette domain-containing protein [Rhizomicrobium sp.]|jgi:ABC-type polysaccharide/polyol phosphate transport system ATPase subunit